MRIEPGILTFGQQSAVRAARLALLDRDGVLIVDHGHVSTPERVEWISGVPQALRALRDAGYAVVIVTNQAGIAKGLFSEEQFLAFMRWLATELALEGAVVDAVYYCPHHPTEGRPPWRVDCPCRKPRPGMLLRAFEDAQAAPALSLMIGDKQTDMEAARAAGVPGHLFTGGDLGEFVRGLVEPAPQGGTP